MKQKRQDAILEIITQEKIETQEELLAALGREGYTATQATISRDIKELSLVKKMVHGSYQYAVSPQKEEGRLSHSFQEWVVSVVAAQNIVVVKTMSGLAMAACTALDAMEIDGNLGTLAGDDTCILIMKDNDSADKFVQSMESLID